MLRHDSYDFVINVFHDIKHWRRCTDLADFMVADGYRVLIITNSADAVITISKYSGHEIINIKQLAEALPVADDLEADWRILARGYGLNQSMNRFIELECVQNLPSYRSKGHVASYTVKLLKAYERLFADVPVNIFFQLLASDIERRVFFLAGKRFARRSVQYTQSVIPDKEIFFVGEDGSADAVFLSAMRKPQDPDAGLSERIKEMMKDRKRKGKYLARRQWSLKDSLRGIYAIKERLLKAHKKEYIRRNIRRFLFVPLRKRFWKLAGGKFQPGEKYVFYPMHAPGEDTVIVRGFPHLDEVALIKIIALSLPAGYKLYVKEHPGWEGWHTLCELGRLRAIEEVRLIESTTNSHAVIEHSACSVVLNSSIWFESLMLEKPVICLGTGIFTGLNAVREVYDLRVLDREIAAVINTVPDRKVLDRFLNAMWNLSYEGVYHYSQERSELTRRLFDALISHLGKLNESSNAQEQLECGGAVGN